MHSPMRHSVLPEGKGIFRSRNSSPCSFIICLTHPRFPLCYLSLFFLLSAPPWFAPRASGGDIVMADMVCDLGFLLSYSRAALRWENDGRVWGDGRLLSLDLSDPPTICLTVGVRRHADPSGRHQFLRHPEWPHPWKALQGDRGTVTRPQQCSCKKKKKMTVCQNSTWAKWCFAGRGVLHFSRNFK